MANLNGCPAIAREALVAEWERPPRDTTALRLLGEVTGRVRDRRLLSTTTRVAATPDRSRAERLAAFRALVAYADPSLRLWIRNLSEPNQLGSRYVVVGKVDHPATDEGVEPLGPNVRQEVLQTFTRLGQTDADPVVRAIAARIAARVQDWSRLGILGPVQR